MEQFSQQLTQLSARTGAWVLTVSARKGRTLSAIHWGDGLVVTCEHGLSGDDEVTVGLPDGSEARARLLGRDPGTDLALLRLEGPAELPRPQLLADASQLQPGQLVLAVARDPEDGLGVALGVIACRSGAWRTWRGGSLDYLIQPDLNLYAGYAGGPLVDTQGRLLGLNTPVLSRGGPVTIPASTLERVVADLQEGRRTSRAYLGVGLHSVALNQGLREKLQLDLEGGTLVVNLEEGGPADRAGLLLGDILIGLAGEVVEGTEEALDLLASLQAGAEVSLEVIRAGERSKLTVVAGDRPHRAHGCGPWHHGPPPPPPGHHHHGPPHHHHHHHGPPHHHHHHGPPPPPPDRA